MAKTKFTFPKAAATCGAILLTAALGCFISFSTTQPTIDAQGVLHEPFFLLPTGFLLVIAGLFAFLAFGISKARAKPMTPAHS